VPFVELRKDGFITMMQSKSCDFSRFSKTVSAEFL